MRTFYPEQCISKAKSMQFLFWAIALVVVIGFAGIFAIPVHTEDIGEIAQSSIFTHWGASFAVLPDGTLWAWGNNEYGRLGDGNVSRSGYDHFIDYNQTQPVFIMDDVVAVSAGVLHTAAIRGDGSLWLWGSNQSGQLGDSTSDNWYNPLPQRIMEDVVAVSTGGHHTMAIRSDGSLWGWGNGGSGQLGDGTRTSRPYPVWVMDGVAYVSAGQDHTMAICVDGALWIWGSNHFGQLGNGLRTIYANNRGEDAVNYNSLTPIRLMDGVIAIYAANAGSFAIKDDNSLWSWGVSSLVLVPTRVMGGIAAVSSGGGQTLAIGTDGNLWGWGSGWFGDHSTRQSVPYPRQIEIDDVVDASIGDGNIMAIKADGSIWAWGSNGHGQLGDGTTALRYSPVQIFDSEQNAIITPRYWERLFSTWQEAYEAVLWHYFGREVDFFLHDVDGDGTPELFVGERWRRITYHAFTFVDGKVQELSLAYINEVAGVLVPTDGRGIVIRCRAYHLFHWIDGAFVHIARSDSWSLPYYANPLTAYENHIRLFNGLRLVPYRTIEAFAPAHQGYFNTWQEAFLAVLTYYHPTNSEFLLLDLNNDNVPELFIRTDWGTRVFTFSGNRPIELARDHRLWPFNSISIPSDSDDEIIVYNMSDDCFQRYRIQMQGYYLILTTRGILPQADYPVEAWLEGRRVSIRQFNAVFQGLSRNFRHVTDASQAIDIFNRWGLVLYTAQTLPTAPPSNVYADKQDYYAGNDYAEDDYVEDDYVEESYVGTKFNEQGQFPLVFIIAVGMVLVVGGVAVFIRRKYKTSHC